jgi:Ca2+-transporting ATPase
MLYAGTHVTAGRARALVVATGPNTEIGRIAALAAGAKAPQTPLERRIERFGHQVMFAAFGVIALVVAIGLARGIPFADIVMIGVSQLVGMVPEGLPVAMTIALAVGVQRMAARRAIVRRLAAVETLGSTTVIASDKTGTLTRNEMTVTAVYLPRRGQVAVPGSGYAPEPAIGDEPGLAELLEACALCNDAVLAPPTADDPRWRALGDPTEAALVTLAAKGGVDAIALRARNPRTAELPFDAATKMMATEHERDGARVVYVKGAPEVVLALCDAGVREDARDAAETMAGAALRVLAFAAIPGGAVRSLDGATFLGLVGQIDPPRTEVRAAVASCRAAGIRPVMITGDHAATALAIGRQLGIAGDGDEAVDGRELEALTDDELGARLDRVAVFARVLPAQKLRIVEAFQRRGEVVAVTGDGVNDAPALVRADVGVAMGVTGTEVAKEAAKIVITDDDFSTIAAAVEEGRVVHRNLKKALLHLGTTSAAEVVVLLAAVALGYPAPFAAVQILWNNLVTEGVITINLVMEPPEGDEMAQRPTRLDEPLLTRALLRRLALLTPTIVVITLGWFIWRVEHGVPMDVAQTETFTLLVVCEWFNVLNCRSEWRSAFDRAILGNPWLVGGLVVGNLLQIAVVFFAPLATIFHTVPIGPGQVLAIGAAASLVLWVEEARKVFVRRHRRR